METHTEYLYSFTNASLTLRTIEYLSDRQMSELKSVVVINTIDRWLIKVNVKDSISLDEAKNLQAVLNELGVRYEPSAIIKIVLARLEMGESPIEIMNLYRVVIVAYGKPETAEIEVFREGIVDKLGYCPQNMA